MLNWIRKHFGMDTYVDDVPPEAAEDDDDGSLFSTHKSSRRRGRVALLEQATARNFQLTGNDLKLVGGEGTAMDAISDRAANLFSLAGANISDTQLGFYASQGFIGYQTMAIIAQNWLVAKSLRVPAEDAVRNGFEIAIADGTEVSPEVLDYIRKMDKHFALTRNLVESVYFKRMFGIRIVKFIVDSTDAEYYEKPFNPDGVTPGSYRGMVQIDPYWITPELNGDAAANPDSKHFYEPTWWRVNGKRIHRTHLVVLKGPEVADILKPTYIYGGLSVAQQIFERVYAAERTANEAPQLAQSKRDTVLHVDVEKALMNQAAFDEKMAFWTALRNNWSVKVVGKEEVIEQFDTSLADFDSVIMTQYQLVASVANVPVTKLMGTVPKGFNATGEYDEAVYHEALESLQTHDLTPIIERHYTCLIRSAIVPKFKIAPFEASPAWKPLDAMTAKEQADVNLLKAQTGLALMQSGAIDGFDERNRLINDPDSGYSGITEPLPEEDLDEGTVS